MQIKAAFGHKLLRFNKTAMKPFNNLTYSRRQRDVIGIFKADDTHVLCIKKVLYYIISTLQMHAQCHVYHLLYLVIRKLSRNTIHDY